MNVEEILYQQLIEYITIDGKKSNGKFKESYILKRPELHQYIMAVSPEFISFSDKLNHLYYQKGYCLHCNARTNRTSNGGFRDYCNKTCASKHKPKEAHNKVKIDDEQLRRMYEDELMKPSDIAKELGTTNVTITKNIRRLGIQRTHAEQQSLYSGARGKIPHNSWEFDRSKITISHMKYWHYEMKYPISAIADQIGCSHGLLYQFMKKSNLKVVTNPSKPELKLMEFLDSVDINYIYNYREFGKELDIFIPEYNIAIEVNGVFWHSQQQGKDEQYHINKTNMANDNRVFLFHFWCFEIEDNFEIIQSMLLSKLGKCIDVLSTECEMRVVCGEQASLFLNDNHILGDIDYRFNCGLYYNNTLVTLATFSLSKEINYNYEMTRYCNAKGFNVIRGMAKLMDCVEGTIIHYSDIRYATLDYLDGGFELIDIAKPDYFFYNIPTHERMTSDSFPNILPKDKWTKCFDCGLNVWSRR